jgi:hypothetical protein
MCDLTLVTSALRGSQEMQHLEQTSQPNLVYRPDDEIDLVDLIGFLWRIRRYIAAGVGIGVLGATALSVVGQRKAADPSNKQIAYSVPLIEDESSTTIDPTLTPEERLTKINDMLITPETAKVFLNTLSENGLNLQSGLDPTAQLSFFLAQQKNEADKQKLAKVSTWAGGGLVFTGSWATQIEPARAAAAVVQGLNRMIDAYNAQITTRIEARRHITREKMAAMLHIRAQISAQLFELKDRLGPTTPLTDALLASPAPVSTTPGSETEIIKVIRVLGLLEHTKKITPQEAQTEKSKLARLQEEYVALLPYPQATTDGKKEQKPTGVLYKVSAPKVSGVGSDAEPIAQPALESSPFKSGLNKSPMILVVLGILLGGFLGTLVGGFAQFWRTNQARIRSALTS